MCHPDHYQCLGKFICGKVQKGGNISGIGRSRLRNSKQPCKNLRGRQRQICIRKNKGRTNRQPRRNSGQPCLKFRGQPTNMKICRKKHGINRAKRDVSDYHLDNSTIEELTKNKVILFINLSYITLFMQQKYAA